MSTKYNIKTIGEEFKPKTIEIENVIYKLDLYDRKDREIFITEWSVPIRIVFNQSKNYDFVVDWS